MKLGFTGTQGGQTPAQRAGFRAFLLERKPDEFHHGDCVGSDEEAHNDVYLFVPDCIVVVHPPANSRKRAYRHGDVTMPPAPYLERNHHIVDATDELVATPRGMAEELRSGTWATVRYARRLGRRVTVIYPDGTQEV